jgi:putative RNA 2'-phosphotransferase
MENNLKDLSKIVSHALRHVPWEYELELDGEGWTSVETLLTALKNEKHDWKNLSEADLIEMIKNSDKKRHELKNGKIRALYGHSIPTKLIVKTAEPPEILFHGTSPEIIKLVNVDGLRPMGRHYVHLSVDKEMALQVGHRKSASPRILLVKAKEAHRDRINFYIGNEHVWLTDNIPPKYIVLL